MSSHFNKVILLILVLIIAFVSGTIFVNPQIRLALINKKTKISSFPSITPFVTPTAKKSFDLNDVLDIYDGINFSRTGKKLPLITINPLLELSAKARAYDLAYEKSRDNYQSMKEKDVYYFMNLVGYNYKYASENISRNLYSGSDVYYRWEEEERLENKKFIIDENINEMGAGYVCGKIAHFFNDCVIVIHFGGT